MGFLDRLTGRNTPPVEEEEAAASTSAPAPDSSAGASPSGEHLTDAGGNTDFAAMRSKMFEAEGERIYNPYEGLNVALDRRVARGEAPIGYRLPKELEYVFTEEASVKKRSWSENLCYYTGSGYLAGALVGGSRGGIAALRKKPEFGLDTNRLRINRLLNMSGKAGRQAGNALGALGLFFAACESGLDYAADGRLPDSVVSVVSGATTGALYRSVRGPRAAVVAGGVGAVAASALVLARATIARGL